MLRIAGIVEESIVDGPASVYGVSKGCPTITLTATTRSPDPTRWNLPDEDEDSGGIPEEPTPLRITFSGGEPALRPKELVPSPGAVIGGISQLQCDLQWVHRLLREALMEALRSGTRL